MVQAPPKIYHQSRVLQPIAHAGAAQLALSRAVEQLKPQTEAIFVREPLVDPQTPATSDLDLLVFADVDRMLFERLPAPGRPGEAPPIDLIWLPAAALQSAADLAGNGVIPHRLLSSRLVYDRSGQAENQVEALRQAAFRPDIQAGRLTGFLDLGYLTVREIGVTWDFPALALFWVHVAYTAALAALCDSLRILCPNVYTRPMDYLRQAEQATGLRLEPGFVRALRLDVSPDDLIAPLRRIHRLVSGRFPEPDWPQAMRSTTRYEYRYFGSPQELDWRIDAAGEMAAGGDRAAAGFYLRFWAYSLARIPMVHRRAQEGIDVSFVRPARAMRPELMALCPEIVEDLAFILGGYPPLTVGEVMSSLDALATFRRQVLTEIKAQGIHLRNLKSWQPFKSAPAS